MLKLDIKDTLTLKGAAILAIVLHNYFHLIGPVQESEFDFDPSKVTILHEIDEYEINRHRQLSRTGKKIDRRPVYCATDYHYIRFNTSRFYYEC
jgi:hypothetical protein